MITNAVRGFWVRPFLAIAGGAGAWPFVVFAAAFAMANNGHDAALSLVAAGILSGMSVSAGIALLVRPDCGAVRGFVAALGSLSAAAAGCVTLDFALEFHW